MAILGRWTGGVKAQGNLPETWTAPNSLFDTQQRNDSSAYGWASSTSILTLPSTGLANGYLIIASFEYEDTSNGRFNPQGRFIQASGSGNFLSGYTGGYDRDNSEDRAYVRTFGFIDSPSASATLQFQWKADTDDSTGGTVRSVIEIVPLYYSNVGIYRSVDHSQYGGTTPNQVIGFTAQHESDTASIEMVSNVVTLKGDNKRYLALGSQFFEGRGGRTQRWHGFRIDGIKEDAAKAYSYYRNTSNDESGDLFTWLIDRATTNITIDQFCYRGDGVGNLQGGADVDGTDPGVGEHCIIVLELNDSAEVFRSRATANSSNLATSPTALDVNLTTDFNDTESFTDVSNSSINCVKTGDYLFGANVSAASNAVSNTGRYTGYSELTINGAIQAHSVSGDYLRNNQGTIDTFGWSANNLSFLGLTAGDDVGVTVTELAGSEGSGAPVSPSGWTGFWGINLDTLEEVGGGVTLTVHETSHGLLSETPTISHSYSFSTNESAHSLISDQTILAHSYTLLTGETGHNLISDQPNLSSAYQITTNETAHGLISDSVALSSGVNLSVNSAGHGLISDSIIVQHGYNLTVDSGEITHQADGVILSHEYNLASFGTTHSLTSEGVVLTTAGNLIVNNSVHGLSSEEVGLIQSYVLVVSESFHGLLSDTPTLTQSITISANSGDHSHLSESPELVQGYNLLVNDSLHGVSSEEVILPALLTAENTLTNHYSEQAILQHEYLLAVLDCFHEFAGDTIIIAGTQLDVVVLHSEICKEVELNSLYVKSVSLYSRIAKEILL